MGHDFTHGTYGYLTEEDGHRSFQNIEICDIIAPFATAAFTKCQFEILQELCDNKLTKETSLVTYGGDWGIKKHRKFNTHVLSIESYGLFQTDDPPYPQVSVDIAKISSQVKRWYVAHTADDIGGNIYPIPLNVSKDNWSTYATTDLRSIKKNHFCLANFTMTSAPRMDIAEWAWNQEYIDCLFPKRYPTQDKDLNMPILSDEKIDVRQSLAKLASYKYAISPTGNGIDAFRTWECIMCNTVPIVKNNFMNRVFSQIWPMILVNRYQTDNICEKITEFEKLHPDIEYDYSLLLEKNFAELLDRLEYESNRLRRT